MTATPIPRTLMLTAHGDMDVSRLTERPPGRQPIETRTLSLDRLDEVVDGVARALARAAQVYWICTLVEESENVDLAADAASCRALQQRFGDNDRQSVVQGKSVSVRVEPGGRSFLKNKK